MKTYTKQDFHNPEQLTRQQVGEGYRLFLSEEINYRGATLENIQLYGSSGKWLDGNGSVGGFTYRVPLATPLPDGIVLSSNECCWSDQPRKKRVYCAGGMTGYPDWNFPAFYAAAESLEKQGYEPVNPAQLDIEAGYTLEKIKQLDPAEFQEFLKGAAKRDLDALQQCDAIALLPGWENSKGAMAEKAVAEWLGLEVMYLDGAECSSDGAGVFGEVGSIGDVGVLGPVDTGYSDHIKQPDEDGWIPHVPGDPMPCNPGEQVEVKLGNGLCSSFGRVSSSWYWGDSCTKGGVIVAWRPAQPKQPYNSDERAEWGIDAPTVTSTPQYTPDDPKGAAGAKKAPMWLLPAHALQQTSWVHKLGSEKYGPYNWRKTSVCATTYISAIMRHLDAWRDGEDNDPESGVSHIAHVAASCNILLDAQHCGKLNDDRSKSCQI